MATNLKPMDLPEALDVAKSLARQFSAFAKLADAAEALAVLLGRESDLQAHVARLTAERDGVAKDVAGAKDARATAVAAIAAAQKDKAAAEQARDAALAERDAVLGGIEGEKTRVAAVRDTVQVQLDTAKAQLVAVRETQAQEAATHKAALAETVAKRDAIAAEIAPLQSHLDELRDKLSKLLA